MADPADEMVDVVDDEGRTTRVVTRAEMRARRLRHRCVFVVVRSNGGEVLVHLRSPHKDLWPSRWDLCCGGVVGAGEDWEHAALRELAEEVGISVQPIDLRYLGEATYTDPDVDEVAKVWEVVADGPFTFGDGEVVEARFVTVDELALMMSELPFVADSTAIVAPLVLG